MGLDKYAVLGGDRRDSPYRRMKRGKYELQWTSKAYILHHIQRSACVQHQS